MIYDFSLFATNLWPTESNENGPLTSLLSCLLLLLLQFIINHCSVNKTKLLPHQHHLSNINIMVITNNLCSQASHENWLSIIRVVFHSQLSAHTNLQTGWWFCKNLAFNSRLLLLLMLVMMMMMMMGIIMMMLIFKINSLFLARLLNHLIRNSLCRGHYKTTAGQS